MSENNTASRSMPSSISTLEAFNLDTTGIGIRHRFGNTELRMTIMMTLFRFYYSIAISKCQNDHKLPDDPTELLPVYR